MGTIRRFDLQNIIDKHKCNVFVETGTLYGDGVDYALQFDFEKIISVEINNELAKKAQDKYKDNPKVEIVCSDSASYLRKVHYPESNILFWLDAHFPGADANLAKYKDELDRSKNTPLECELGTIAKRKNNDVIICDDLWLYEDWQTETGTFNEHCKRHGHDITRADLCTDGVLEKFEELFSETHEMKKMYQDQGYIVFTPKNNG